VLLGWRGLRNFDRGNETVEDRELAAALRRKAVAVTVASMLLGLLVAMIAVAI
jgi:hypothetical protein